MSLLPQPLSTESAESAGSSKSSPRAQNYVIPHPDTAAGTSRARDSRACPELSAACPELVGGLPLSLSKEPALSLSKGRIPHQKTKIQKLATIFSPLDLDNPPHLGVQHVTVQTAFGIVL